MARRRTYDPEVKAEVLAALPAGQGAEKVAVLCGVLADKAFRLLEAPAPGADAAGAG